MGETEPLRPERLSKTSRLGCIPCLPPKRDEQLTLVACRDRQLEPVALLTNRPIRLLKEAPPAAEDYLRRWPGAEDPIRFLKDRFHLEKFLIDGMEAIRAFFFIIALVFSILLEFRREGKIRPLLVKIARPFKGQVAFPYYPATVS